MSCWHISALQKGHFVLNICLCLIRELVFVHNSFVKHVRQTWKETQLHILPSQGLSLHWQLLTIFLIFTCSPIQIKQVNDSPFVSVLENNLFLFTIKDHFIISKQMHNQLHQKEKFLM